MLLFWMSIHESSSIHFTNFRSLTEPRLGVLGYVYFGGLLRSCLLIVRDIVINYNEFVILRSWKLKENRMDVLFKYICKKKKKHEKKNIKKNVKVCWNVSKVCCRFLMGEPSERFKCFKTDSNYFNEFEAWRLEIKKAFLNTMIKFLSPLINTYT